MSPNTSVVTIGLLGPVAVDSGAGMVEIPGTRARRLLAALTLQPGSVRSASVLIDLVWSDAQPKSPQSALHTQISRLRQALPEGMIAAGSAGYRLDLTGHTLDVDRVRRLIDDGTAGALAAAAQMWRGVPGDDLGDDALAGEVRSLGDELRRRLDARRCRIALDTGDLDTARRVAQAICDDDPLDEPAHLLLMQALQAAGRTNDALAAYARLRRALSSELGVDPGASIEAAHRSMLAGSAPKGVPVETQVPPVRVGARGVGLRAEPNPLLGRDADIDAVLGSLDRHRVVTIAGPGGAGKTRLAQAVGRRAADADRSVFVVELASVRNDDDVVGAVAATLGVGESDLTQSGRPRLPVGDLSAKLIDALHGRNALLVLDNCEQIVDGSARVVSELISAVGDLRVLTTSRAPLTVAGEGIYRLAPLAIGIGGESGSEGASSGEPAMSPAVELFVTRARAVRPDVRIDTEVVAQLCRDLDGLPLAIELAAARVRTLTVTDIARLLAQRLARGRLGLLRSGDRTAPERHRTLHAVIEWSWDLLDAPAQSAMRRLCRFPAGFSTQAAGVVLASGSAATDPSGTGRDPLFLDPLAVDDVLDALVNQSLLAVAEVNGEIRYRMLEMVREFGEEQLHASGEDLDVDVAMTRWATRYAITVRTTYESGDHVAAMVAIVGEADNLIWVLRRCADADPALRPVGYLDAVITIFPVLSCSWVARGLHAEVRNWAPRIVAMLRRPPMTLSDAERELWQVSLLMSVGHLLMLSTDLRQVAMGMTALRSIFRPSAAMTLPADFASAIILARNGYSGLRTICRGARSEVPMVRAIALSVRSNARENVGDLRGALADSLLAKELAVSRNDLWISAMGSMEIGSIHGQSGRYDEAVVHYRNGAELLARLGAEDEVAQVRGYLACALIGAGALSEARVLLDDLSGGWRFGQPVPLGNPEVITATLMGGADLAYAEDDPDLAADIAARTVGYIISEHPTAAQNPSILLVVSAATAMMALTGRSEEAAAHLADLAGMVEQMMAPGGFRDLPQTGSGALACGAVLCGLEPGSADGARLMALGARIRARQDYPILKRARETMATLSGLADDDWKALDTETDRMSRRVALQDILAIMARVSAPV